MQVLIAGGGRTGAQLAALLVGQNHTVRLVEHRPDILSRIHRELPTEVIHEGDAADPSVLEAAGAREAQVLAACTPDDADNLSLCFFARSQFRVPRTIARVNNPATAWLFNQTFGVDVALNQAEILSSLIEEEMSLGDMMTLLKIRRGRYSLVEEKIPAGAPALGTSIKDLTLPDNCVIAAIIRKGEIVIPRGVTTFEEGDEVLAVVDPEGAAELARLFGFPSARPPTPA
ncbi:MAG TPA: NAD-binding protein [Anaerolineales bacterium]|nr:NAD-binding protein [Anaerolineales bacterium]